MSHRLRLGLMFFSAGQRVPVEIGNRIIGHSSYNDHSGQHEFWFENVDAFKANGGQVIGGRYVWPRDMFEVFGNGTGNKPIPVMELVFEEAAQDEVVEKAAPVVIPPPLPDAPRVLAINGDTIEGVRAGRSIRLKDLAAEMNVPPDFLQDVIESDPRFAPIVAGWVRLKESQPQEA